MRHKRHARPETHWRNLPVGGIRRLATEAGLRWISGAHVRSEALHPKVSGPTLGDGSHYLFVVLEK